jgi:hypothetical protein
MDCKFRDSVFRSPLWDPLLCQANIFNIHLFQIRFNIILLCLVQDTHHYAPDYFIFCKPLSLSSDILYLFFAWVFLESLFGSVDHPRHLWIVNFVILCSEAQYGTLSYVRRIYSISIYFRSILILFSYVWYRIPIMMHLIILFSASLFHFFQMYCTFSLLGFSPDSFVFCFVNM